MSLVMAERPIERVLASLSSVKGQLPNLAKEVQEPAEEAEMRLVRSIEWTVVESKTYDTALEQMNVILKYVLRARISPSSFRRTWRMLSHVVKARGRVKVVRLLLDMPPPELAAVSPLKERAAEYLDYRKFFVAWETLERVAELQALEAPRRAATRAQPARYASLFLLTNGLRVHYCGHHRAWFPACMNR